MTVDFNHDTGQLDAVLDYDDYVILFEFKASLLTVAARCGRDMQEFERQFYLKFVENERGEKKGVRQLAESARSVVAADLRFTSERPVVYPVLVCYEPSADSFWVNRYANDIFSHLLGGHLPDRIQPLTVMSIEGLEMALPYLSAGDLTWQQLLDSRFKDGAVDERSIYQAIYDWRESHKMPRRINEYLRTRFDATFHSVLDRYRGGSGTR